MALSVVQLGWIVRTWLGKGNEKAQLCIVCRWWSGCDEGMLRLWRWHDRPASQKPRQHKGTNNNDGDSNHHDCKANNDLDKADAVLQRGGSHELPSSRKGTAAGPVLQHKHAAVLQLYVRPLQEVHHYNEGNNNGEANNNSTQTHAPFHHFHYKHNNNHDNRYNNNSDGDYNDGNNRHDPHDDDNGHFHVGNHQNAHYTNQDDARLQHDGAYRNASDKM